MEEWPARRCGAFKRKMKAKGIQVAEDQRNRRRKFPTVKRRPSGRFDSSPGLTSAIEGLSAAELPLPWHAVFSSSLDSIEPALSRRRHLEGHVSPPLPQPASEEERKRFKQARRSIGKTQLERALSSTFLIGPLTIGTTAYFAYGTI